MLPMILGFLGSAFAPALGVGSLLASAVGTGLGAAIEQKDLGAGLKAGLGSFLGGKLLGGLFGSTAGGALKAPLANQGIMGTGAGAMTTGTPLNLAGGINALMPPAAATQSAGLFGSGMLGSGLQRGMDFAKSATGIGAMLGGSLATPPPTMKLDEGKSKDGISAEKEMVPVPRQAIMPPADYRPGIDPEFDYGVSTPYSYDALVNYRDNGVLPYGGAMPSSYDARMKNRGRRVLPYAEGGETEIEVDDETGDLEAETETKRPVAGNEKTEIVDAIMAIKGVHPQPEIALGKFLAKYGEGALRDLVDSVQSGEFDETVSRFKNGEKGMVRGPGDGSGKDDKVPATIDGEQDVLLTEGEFVMRKDATDALEKMYGGGFLSAVNKAGKRAPEVLRKKVAA